MTGRQDNSSLKTVMAIDQKNKGAAILATPFEF
jgi:hypothetical protein